MGNDRLSTLGGEKLRDLIHRVTIRITQQVAKIDLRVSECQLDLEDDLCTIYTTLDGAYHTKLVLCAERGFLRRLTENMMGEPISQADDLEEYSKEFFNVLCGHVVGEIFRLTKAGASFHAPCFVDGHYAPEMPPGGPEALICFSSDFSESVAVLHDEIGAS